MNVVPRELETGGLPRLVYVGEPSVREAGGSASQLYRLLENYPRDQLRIVESNIWLMREARPPAGVPRRVLWLAPRRVFKTRLAPAVSTWQLLTAPAHAYALVPWLHRFRPEAVLTVALGASWRTAATLSRVLDIPLHMLAHDDPPGFFGFSGPLRPWADQEFGRVYRRAATRLCISPAMAHQFERRYGATGSVMYPLRAEDVAPAAEAPTRRRTGNRGVVVGYVGSFYQQFYARAVCEIGEALATAGGRVIAYTNADGLRTLDLMGAPNAVSGRRIQSSADAVRALSDEADLMLLPMGFLAEERVQVELCFPSKLGDYTATGLPILVWGPASSSAARWAREFPGVAEVVTEEDVTSVVEAVRTICDDESQRREMGARALAVGNALFGHREVVRQFHAALLTRR